MIRQEDEKNVIGLVAAFIIGIGIFLPFSEERALGLSISYSILELENNAWMPVMLVAIIGLFFAFKGYNTFLVIDGVLGVILIVYLYRTYAYSPLNHSAVGFYLTLIGSIGMIAGGLFGSKLSISNKN